MCGPLFGFLRLAFINSAVVAGKLGSTPFTENLRTESFSPSYLVHLETLVYDKLDSSIAEKGWKERTEYYAWDRIEIMEYDCMII